MTVHDTAGGRRGGRLHIPRSRGAFSGFLLIVLGIWGALIPFIGPYFNYAYTYGDAPATTWTWSTGRLWLEVVPGAAAAVGGLILLMTANRASALFGGWLASAAGAWFVVGPIVSRLWGGEAADAGQAIGGTKRQVIEQLGFFSGLGVVILFLAAHAAGRITVRSLRDLEAADRRVDEDSALADGPRRGFGRRTKRRAEVGRDEPRRDEVSHDQPRTSERDSGAGATTVGGHSGSTPSGEDERRTGGSGSTARG